MNLRSLVLTLVSTFFIAFIPGLAFSQTNIPAGVPLTATTLNNAFNNLNVGNQAQFQNGAVFKAGTEVVLGGAGVNANDAVTVIQLANSFINHYTVVATAGPITGNINLGSAPATIDGVSPATNSCVLLTAETSSVNNGLWIYPGSGSAFTTRCAGATAWSGLFGATVYTNTGGTNYGATGWTSTVGATGTVGSTPITFVLSSGGGVIAGTNLAFSGNILNVVNAPIFSGLITGQNGLTISSGASSLQALTATSVNGNTVPSASDTVALLAATQTLTNKSISGSEINSGVVGYAYGGTGLSSTPTNGQLNIGNGAGFTRAALTGGTDITITNGAGSISVGLTSATTTVNGTPCVLGSTCSPTVAASSITSGTTTVASCTSGYFLYNNAGVLGCDSTTGYGAVVLASGSSIANANLNTPDRKSVV